MAGAFMTLSMSVQYLFIVVFCLSMTSALEMRILNLLLLHGDGLSTREPLTRLRPRVSQPTRWRTLDSLRAQGALIREGKARATRYHARRLTDLAVLRSRRMHESVAKRLWREPALRLQALERLNKLRAANPHGRRYRDRWYELLQGPLVEVLRVMTEPAEAADLLRKESPMSALVLPAERRRIFDPMRTD
jgi:hypothetical protein